MAVALRARIIAMALIVCFMHAFAQGDTITWTGAAGNNSWHTGGNWNLGHPPQTGDSVVIPDAGPAGTVSFTDASTVTLIGIQCEKPFSLVSGAITINGAATFANSMTVSGGTIGGTSDITVDGLLTLAGGTFIGSGNITASNGILLNNGFVILRDSRTLINPAGQTATSQGASSFLRLDGQSRFENHGTFVIAAGGVIDTTNTPNGQGFMNYGAFIKNGSATQYVNLPFVNSGSVALNAGTLSVSVSSTHTGEIAGNGTLLVASGTHVFQAASAIRCANTALQSGSVTIDGEYDVAGTTTISGATVEFPPAATLHSLGTSLVITAGAVTANSGDDISVTQLNQSGGSLFGASSITVSGLCTLSGGTIGGSGAINANGGLQVSGFVQLQDSRALNNAAGQTATLQGTSAYLRINGAAVFNNHGTFIVTGNGAMDTTTTVGQQRFNNYGIYRKSSAGLQMVALPFMNHHAVEIGAGTMSMYLGGSHAGEFSGDGTLLLAGGTHVFLSTSQIMCANVTFQGGVANVGGRVAATGSTLVSGGDTVFTPSADVTSIGNSLAITAGTLDLSSGENMTVSQFSQSGGTLRGTFDMTVNGLCSLSGGTIAGSGAINANGGILLNGFVQMQDSRVMNHAANQTASFQGASAFLRINNSAVFNNNGLFIAESNGSIDSTTEVTNQRFNNNGVYRKTINGTQAVGLPFANNGVLEVFAGRLDLYGRLTNLSGNTLTGGTYNLRSTLRLSGGNIVTNAADILLDGTAAAVLSVGTNADLLANLATNAQSGRLTLANGRNLALSGALTNAGQIVIGSQSLSTAEAVNQTGGEISLAGGSLSSGSPYLNISGGRVSGHGVIHGNVTNASGVLAPGPGAAALLIDGSYTQASGGGIEIDVTGAPGALQFDALTITQTATLAGTLAVSVENPDGPALGDVYEILSAASRSGVFEFVTTPCLTGGNRLLASYGANSASLRVVNPLPADMNCDCSFNNFDIDPFVVAITDVEAYQLAYPDCDVNLADVNQDGLINNFDIDPLVTLLAGGA